MAWTRLPARPRWIRPEHGNNGTYNQQYPSLGGYVQGAASVPGTYGLGTAVNFQNSAAGGGDGWIAVPALPASHAMSFEAWFHVPAYADYVPLPGVDQYLWFNYGSGTGGISLYLTTFGTFDTVLGGAVNGSSASYGYYSLSGPNAIAPSVSGWMDLAFTYDNVQKTTSVYLNGNCISTQALAPGDPDPLISASTLASVSGTSCFNDLMDEVAIYGYALTADQVKAHYERHL